MVERIDFDTFHVTYDEYLRTAGMREEAFEYWEPNLDPVTFYDQLLARLKADTVAWAMLAPGLSFERTWYAAGAPEYRVYPGILEALEHTSVDIDAKYFRMPFEAYMLRFPKHHVREHEAAPYIRALLVTTLNEPRSVRDGREIEVAPGVHVTVTPPNAPLVSKLCLYLCFDVAHPTWIAHRDFVTVGDGDNVDVNEGEYNYMKFPLLPGVTIQNTFNESRLHPKDRAYWPDRAFYNRLLRYAVGVAFFGIGAEKQKRPIVERVRLPRWQRRQIARETGERAREVESPIFDVGRTLVVPRYESDASRETHTPAEDASCASCLHYYATHDRGRCRAEACECRAFDTGRHLAHGHIRSGHLHWYATGPRNPGPGETNDYTLRWVDPTVVRPDLPLAPAKTYDVKPPRQPTVKADLTKLGG